MWHDYNIVCNNCKLIIIINLATTYTTIEQLYNKKYIKLPDIVIENYSCIQIDTTIQRVPV